MTTFELVEQLKHLSNSERLTVIEEASRLIRLDIVAGSMATRNQRLAAAAMSVQDLYEHGGELTEWTALDAEEFADENVPR